MEGIIEQIKDKVKNCDETSKEGRARKGAYIDCITMIKEIRQCSDSDRNAVLADVLALTQEEILDIASMHDVTEYGIGLIFDDGYRIGMQMGIQYIIDRLKGQVC